MTKNSLRALATALVFVPAAAFAKAPVASNTPMKANAPATSAPAKDGKADEKKDEKAAHKAHGKGDAAKGDNKEKSDAKH